MNGFVNNKIIRLLFLTLFIGGIFLFAESEVRAAIVEVEPENNETREIEVNVEDFLIFKPLEETYNYRYFSGENGKKVFHFGNGKFWLSAPGRATIIISGTDKEGRDLFIADYRIRILEEKSDSILIKEEVPAEPLQTNSIDMEEVSLGLTELKDERTVIKSGDKRVSHFTLDVKSPLPLVEGTNASLSFKNENSKMTYSVSLKEKLQIEVRGHGKDKLKILINGKEFIIDIDIVEVGLSETTIVLAKGDVYELFLNGVEGVETEWKSSDENVAKINKKGKITALSEGNAIIRVKAGKQYFAAVVSVTSKLKRDVANYTRSYSKGNQYSQPKRMLEGFYDCSSLVWRAYKKFGHLIIMENYAPVAAAMGKYYEKNNKLVEGGITRENIDKLAFIPGDLLFVEGKQKNKRYRNINHVEMIYGYSIEGMKADGEPILGIRYANNHQIGFTGFVGRPDTEKSELGVNSY